MWKSFNRLNYDLWKNRKIIFSMGWSEFKNEYAGSALGIFWGIVKPFIMVFVYSIVFSSDVDGVPFFLWMIPAVFFWNFLSDSLNMGTSAIRSNGHLVKKVVFPISVLPAVKIFNNLINHILFMVIAFILMLVFQVPINLEMIQIIYYLFAGIIFTLGVVRLTSAMAVMSVDIAHFIGTITQLLFWGSPVLWSPDGRTTGLIHQLLPLLKLNPYFYLIEGYRNSFFVPGSWFFNDPLYTLYFWGLTFVIYMLGSWYYEKNRKEFADVL